MSTVMSADREVPVECLNAAVPMPSAFDQAFLLSQGIQLHSPPRHFLRIFGAGGDRSIVADIVVASES